MTGEDSFGKSPLLQAFHSSDPPKGASGGSTCHADDEPSTFEDPISHVSRWVKLLHGANDILVIQLFFDKTDERWGEKRPSYREVYSNFGCGKLHHFRPAGLVFGF